MLISLEGQCSNNLEREFSEDNSNKACFMIQRNNSLEVNSESHLDDCASTSNDNSVDAYMLNEELF